MDLETTIQWICRSRLGLHLEVDAKPTPCNLINLMTYQGYHFYRTSFNYT